MKQALKRCAALLLILPVLLETGMTVGAVDGNSWFVKRNGNCTPGFPSDATQLSGYGVYYIDHSAAASGEKILYLTFDAGYENGNIERILKTLNEESVPAAFFVLDNLIINNTDLISKIAESGHLICNHTKSHKNLCRASEEYIREDLEALENIYRTHTGLEMAKYFRFPEGKYSESAVRTVAALGYKTVFWSFGYEDWDNSHQPGREYAMNKILQNTHPGAVFLFHPTSKTNADILPDLIREWRKMGYTFGTLDQLTERN